MSVSTPMLERPQVSPTPSKDDLPTPPATRKRRSGFARKLLGYTYVFVAIAIWNVMFSTPDIAQNNYDDMTMLGPSNTSTTTSNIKVLIVRTVSPSEIPNVIDDVMFVKSFYNGNHEAMKEKSMEYCPMLNEAGYDANLDPLYNGTSQSYPNHILCNTNKQQQTNNNFLTVRADFMLFARSDGYARNITNTIDEKSKEMNNDNAVTTYKTQIDVRDVSLNPIKLWNWILHCDEDRLVGYDYVWFIDGDIHLRTLNWHAFWQQVKIMKPKITQAATIGSTHESDFGTVHHVLRHKTDQRLMAAEVPIIEIQSPLLEVETWLDFRNIVSNDPEPMEQIEQGGETCFDMAW